jgi:hypothetical protein
MDEEPQFDAEAENLVRQAIDSCVDTIPRVNWHREFTRSQHDLETANHCIRLLEAQSATWKSQAITAQRRVAVLTNWLIFFGLLLLSISTLAFAQWVRLR